MPPPFSDDYSSFLDQLMAANRGLYGNVGEPRNIPDLNFGELGGIGQYFNNPLAILGVQTGLNWAFGQTGLMPSQFAPGRNLYDQLQDRTYWTSRRAALRESAQADRATYVQMLRGIARMRGTPWGLEQQQAAGVISGDVAAMAPILAELMPETFDALHGTRGSATVMARFLHRGGQFGVDPVTGQTGLEAESVSAMTREIQSRYFAPGQDLAAWRGMGMGRAGALFEELQNRGMTGRSIGTYDPGEQLQRVTGSQAGREAFVRRLAEDEPEEFRRLRGRAEATLPADPLQRMAGTDTVARQGLEALQRLDPEAFNRAVDRFDRASREVERVASRPFAEQLRALSRDPEAAREALDTVRRRDPATFDRLRTETDRLRPGGALAGLPQDEQVRRVAEAEGVTADAIRTIQRSQPGRFEALLRQFDADAVARRMQDMAGAVGAMREIFGDLGRPDAPMSELIEGLNAMTQGGLATMNPAELERMVRTTRVLSRQTGMGLNAMMGMAAQGAATADRLGLSRAFVMPVQQDAAAFGAAFGQVGRGDLPAWGRVDRDRLTLMDQQLRMQAAQSEGANRLGAAMRIVEAQQNAGIAVGPGLQAMAQAIRAGATEFAPDPTRPAETRSLLMSEEAWRSFMTAQGVQPGLALQILRGREENQRPTAQFGIQNIIRSLQGPTDVRQFISGSFRQSALAALQDAGLGADQANRLAEPVGQAQATALMAMPVEQRTDIRLRNQLLGDVASRVLRDQGIDPAVIGRFQGGVQAEAGWGNLERARARSPAFAGYPSVQAMLDANNREVNNRQRVVRQQADVTVRMQTLLGGLGQSGPMQRLMDMIQNPPPNLTRAIGEVFNGVEPEEIRRRVLGMAPDDVRGLADVGAPGRMAVAMQELLTTVQQYRRTGGDPRLTPEEQLAEQQNLLQRASALLVGGPAATPEIRRELERAGVIRPGEDMAPALAQLRRDPTAFPALDREGGRNRIAALLSVGGGLDPATARRETERILAEHHLRPEQLGRALAGELGLPEDVRDYLRSLQGMGIAASADAAGVAIGATVGPRQLEDIRLQATLLAQDLGDDVARALPADAAPARVTEARRHAEAVLTRGDRTVDALLGSIETTRGLGTGGFELARGVREKQKELALIARDLGVAPAEVIVKGDRKDERVRRFLTLYGEVQAGLGQMSLRLAEPGRHGTMTRDEEEAYTTYQTQENRSDEERNRAMIERVLGDDATAALVTPEQRQETAGLLGTGIEGAYRRQQLDRAIEARGDLLLIGRAHHLDFAGLRAEFLNPESRVLSAHERTAMTEDLRRAGVLAEGVGPENLRQFLDTLGRPREASRDPGLPTEIRLTGKLDLSDGKMEARGEPVTPHGATPAVT